MKKTAVAMIVLPESPAISCASEDSRSNIPNFFSQFVRLAGPFWNVEGKNATRFRTLALVALTVLQVVVSIATTEWSFGLFNALEQHSMPRLLTQIWMALAIFATNMAVMVLHLKIKRRLQLDWRNWLTDRLIGQWMNEGHHCQVVHMQGKHDNPDGRIAEDIRIATEYAIDLCHSLFFCSLLLISFTKILWTLSGTAVLSLGEFEIPIPGYLVWEALLYASAASILGYWIGSPLTHATDARQTEEANFRFGLMRARENSEAIALARGETDERRRFSKLFLGIVEAWRRQTQALSRILLFTSGYSVVSMALPILVAAPRYIAGGITLGALVQSAQAFQQMAAALSWPVDNLAKVAEWRASVERVLGLTRALNDLEEDITQADPNTILVETTDQPALIFHQVCIADPEGNAMVTGLDAEISPGERVLLSGDPSLGGKIFKVIAGLWPWGCGRVELPISDRIFFMPPRPYLPIESLRAAVSYPAHPDAFEVVAVENALRRVGLEELLDRLDEVNTWEKMLSREKLQRLGFARLLLHQPKWILFHEALDSLDAEGAKKMMGLVYDELPDATWLTITYQPEVEAFHQRQIVLERSTCGPVLMKETRKRRETERSGKATASLPKQIWDKLHKERCER